MKIEIGESLILSWLKHVKECQVVQTNWKASYKWELKNREKLQKLMDLSNELFLLKYGYSIYKGNKSIEQLIGQAEIDVLGINFEDQENQIYCVDVAFHEAGLNYGSKEETITRVIKKCLRTAMCINGYFGLNTATILFASPKINPLVNTELINCVDDMMSILKELDINYDIRIIGNEDFERNILNPVLSVAKDVADTSELFMRSLQMYNLFVNKSKSIKRSDEVISNKKEKNSFKLIEPDGLNGFEEMKIGALARTVLRKALEDGKASKDEIEKMQTKDYSKETFDIQFPLLLKTTNSEGIKPIRYYANPINIYGEEYFMCSEWYEVATNNDRPYLLKWLALHL